MALNGLYCADVPLSNYSLTLTFGDGPNLNFQFIIEPGRAFSFTQPAVSKH